jgi:hypothetical protein
MENQKVDFENNCPTCNSSMEWMPLDCPNRWHQRIKLGTSFAIHHSFDAQEWAAYFMETLREHPEIVIDREFMMTWFANSLMRGYDEHYWRTRGYKRQIRRALYPWWNWKHWAMADRLAPALLEGDCR